MRISDWCSYVCSSDLPQREVLPHVHTLTNVVRSRCEGRRTCCHRRPVVCRSRHGHPARLGLSQRGIGRSRLARSCARADTELSSEERRGGKAGVSTCRSRWSPYQKKKKKKKRM